MKSHRVSRHFPTSMIMCAVLLIQMSPLSAFGAVGSPASAPSVRVASSAAEVTDTEFLPGALTNVQMADGLLCLSTDHAATHTVNVAKPATAFQCVTNLAVYAGSVWAGFGTDEPNETHDIELFSVARSGETTLARTFHEQGWSPHNLTVGDGLLGMAGDDTNTSPNTIQSFYTFDGTSWTEHKTIPSALHANDAVYLGGYWYVVGLNAGLEEVCRSADGGQTWTVVKADDGNSYDHLSLANGTLVLTGLDSSATKRYWTSTDGSTWTQQPWTGISTADLLEATSVFYAHGSYFLTARGDVGKPALYSATALGGAWAAVSGFSYAGQYAYCYGTFGELDGYTYLAYRRCASLADNQTWTAVLMRTADGSTWSQVETRTCGNNGTASGWSAWCPTVAGIGRVFYGNANNDGVYAMPVKANGMFVSRLLDMGQPSSSAALSWNAEQPAGTSLSFQVRSAATSEGVDAAVWQGPDGTDATWFTTQGLDVALFGRYVQYRAEFTSNATNCAWTPYLTSVTFAPDAAVAVDSTPPTTTASLDSAWHTAPTTVSLFATDALSGVVSTYYRLGSDPTTYTYSDPFTVSSEGTTNVEYWSVDAASNAETHHTGVVKIDTQAPVTTSDAAATYTVVASIHLFAKDTESGVADTRYSLDGGALQSGTVVITSTLGTHTLRFYSVDAAGNTEGTTTSAFVVVAGNPRPPTTGRAVGFVRAAGRSGLAGAVVSAPDGSSCVTTMDGSFTLAVSSTGTQTLTCSAPNFKTANVSVSLSSATSAVVDVALQPVQLPLGLTRLPSKSALTFKRKRGRAKFVLSARLSDARGALPAGVVIYIQKSLNGRKWSTLAVLRTNGDGVTSKAFNLRRAGTTYYRWYSPATSYDSSQTSSRQRIRVR